MTFTLLVPVLAAIVGLLTYALAGGPKAQEVGRITFACGLLVSLWLVAGHVIRLP